MNHSAEFLIGRVKDGTVNSELSGECWEKCRVYYNPNADYDYAVIRRSFPKEECDKR